MVDDKIERAKARLNKARADLAKVQRLDRQNVRKERDTALFTLGACFAAFYESDDPEYRSIAAVMWEKFAMVAPSIVNDARRAALLNVFDLSVPDERSGADKLPCWAAVVVDPASPDCLMSTSGNHVVSRP
jgi:hypothetical protein